MNLIIKEATLNIEPKDLDKILGMRVRKNIKKDQVLKWKDFK